MSCEEIIGKFHFGPHVIGAEIGLDSYHLIKLGQPEIEDMDASILTSFFGLCLLLMVGFAEHVGSLNDCADAISWCGDLVVRFPFSIKGSQSEHCGYPGFDLECSATNHALLELPISLKLNVTNIDYISQTLDLFDPYGCFSMQLRNLTSFASPFQFRLQPHNLNQYTFFNCSSSDIDTYKFYRVPCLSSSTYQVLAIRSGSDLDYLPLWSCTKIPIPSSVPNDFSGEYYILRLMWSDPTCKHCESKGKVCGFKNTTTFETECMGDHTVLSRKPVITGAILASILFSLVGNLAVPYIHNLHKSRKTYQAIVEKFLKDYKALKPTRYSYAEIKRITNQFVDKLSQGSYGAVFKGKISTQFIVAVKILVSSEGNEEEFINEVGTMGKIHHVNIVRLIGFCADGFRRALVYEFLPNGSLQNYINSPDNKKNFLGWKKLQEIALGIAKGIEYLHQGCEQRIFHFDIKPHNVLLDHDFTPKICDFGLAKLCSKDQSIVSLTTARGTMGYIAPEVFSRNFGNVSHKSDVYSFGMLLLETIGWRKITEDTGENSSHIYYPEWIYNILEEREDVRIHIEDEGDAKITKKMAVVGLWCIQWHAVDRPSMQTVVHMLEGEGDKLSVPPNPFNSKGPPTRKSAGAPRRYVIQGLEIIQEVE